MDFNQYLTKLRWQTATGEFNEMKRFSTDCFVYEFRNPLNYNEQNNFMTFVGDSDNLNSLTPIDFCNYFLQNNILFDVKYQYVRKIGLIRNYKSYKIVKMLQKKIKEILSTKEYYYEK